MVKSFLVATMLLSAALALTSDPASAASITIKCGSDKVTVTGEKQCEKSDIIRTEARDDGTAVSTKVGESVHCRDNQGNTSSGSCTDGEASCGSTSAGKTGCQIAILPTPTPPPRIPGQRQGMPQAEILEGGTAPGQQLRLQRAAPRIAQ